MLISYIQLSLLSPLSNPDLSHWWYPCSIIALAAEKTAEKYILKVYLNEIRFITFWQSMPAQKTVAFYLLGPVFNLPGSDGGEKWGAERYLNL